MTEEQLKEINQLLKAAKFDKVIEMANLQNDLLTDDHFLSKLALAYFFSEDFEKSTDLFERICQNSTNAEDWFNYSLSLIYNIESHKFHSAMSMALKYNEETETNGKGIPTPFMRFFAAQSFISVANYQEAYIQVCKLCTFYREAPKTDDETLYDLGIPLYSEFITLVKKLLSEQDTIGSKKLIENILSALGENGKRLLNELIEETSK